MFPLNSNNLLVISLRIYSPECWTETEHFNFIVPGLWYQNYLAIFFWDVTTSQQLQNNLRTQHNTTYLDSLYICLQKIILTQLLRVPSFGNVLANLMSDAPNEQLVQISSIYIIAYSQNCLLHRCHREVCLCCEQRCTGQPICCKIELVMIWFNKVSSNVLDWPTQLIVWRMSAI